MTTVLASAAHGLMVCDSRVSDGDRKWRGRKVWRFNGLLVGVAGCAQTYIPAVEWLRKGGNPPAQWDDSTDLLVLSREGLFVYAGGPIPERVRSGREAIGTGSQAAMAAFEALRWADPVAAVRIACRYDAQSDRPVRSYYLDRSM